MTVDKNVIISLTLISIPILFFKVLVMASNVLMLAKSISF